MRPKTPRQFLSLIASLIVCLAAMAVQAQTITYGTALGENSNIDANKIPLVVGDGWVLHLGYFSDGVSPSAKSVDLWSGTFTSLSSTPLQNFMIEDGAGNVTSTLNSFQHSFSLSGAPKDADVWLWAHNGAGEDASLATEWALFRDESWTIPEADPTRSISWKVFDITTNVEVAYGAVDNGTIAREAGAQESGTITLADEGFFQIQTALAPPVLLPEPGAAVLLMLGISMLVARRRRG